MTRNERLRALLREARDWMIDDTCHDCERGGCELRKRINAALAEPMTPSDVENARLDVIWQEMVRERDEARAQRDEADSAAHLAETRLREIVELVGEGGDGTAFGSVESMLMAHKHVQEILRQQHDATRAEVEHWKVAAKQHAENHVAAVEACFQAERERDEAQRLLGEILSRIHNDGGQYQEEYGSAQATLDAERIVAGLRAREFATSINPCRMFP